MMDELYHYRPEDIICANLSETAARSDMVIEQEAAHLHELAVELVRSAATPRELAESLSDLLPPAAFEEIGRDRARGTRRRVMLCRAIIRLLSKDEPPRPEWFLSDDDGEGEAAAEADPAYRGKIVYQRSSYADAAYLLFAKVIESAHADYTQSFPAACETVYNALAEFCILPIENASEGLLSGFARLIDRFGLKIVATAEVSTSDAARRTTFALLRRRLRPIGDASERGERLMEVALTAGERPTGCDILQAALLCRVQVEQMHTLQRGEGGGKRFHFIFRGEDTALSGLMLYLLTYETHCEPIGLYRQLRE